MVATTKERKTVVEVRALQAGSCPESQRLWALVLAVAMGCTAMLSATGAQGSDCGPDPKATAVERADVVAAARVVNLSAPADGPRRVKLQVQRLFKGATDWEIEVTVSGGDDGDIFEVGQSYLVFAKREAALLRVEACSGTLLAVEAGGIIDGLGRGHKPGRGAGHDSGAGPQQGAGGAASAATERPPATQLHQGAVPPASAGGCAACSLGHDGAGQGWWLLLALAGAIVGRRRAT